MKLTTSKVLWPSAIAMAMWASAPAFAVDGFATGNGGTTGGAGGNVVYATSGTEIHAALCNRASSDTPIIIHVEGTINHGNTSKVSGDSCNTADDKIELKEVSNISLIGVGSGALFDELGIHLRSASNVILQNLHVRNVKKSGSPTSNGGDAIGMESDVYNVWADHLTLEAQGGESAGYDALFDMKADTKYVTLSYSILRNSGRGGLVGSSDGDTNNGPVTFHHNLYENIDSRTPLLRGATAHAYNNYYVGLQKSGMNPRIGGEIKAEHNYFQDSKNPLGTFYTNDIGYWEVNGNIWDNITWTAEGDDNHPAGPNPVSTTSINIPYSYTLDDASCVPQIILETAGANTGLAQSNGSCEVSSSSSSSSSVPSSSSSSSSEASSSSSDSSEPGELGSNLAIGAGSDGSSKGSGSYGSVRDGDLGTYWQPSGTSGERIAIKWSSDTTFNTVIIRELNNATNSWQLEDHNTGDILASGSGLGSEAVITFADTTTDKVNLYIDGASSAPQIAEFEVYNASGVISSSSSSEASSSSSSSEQSSSDDTVGLDYFYPLDEEETGFCGVDGTIDNEHAGFGGVGYANTENQTGTGVTWSVGAQTAGQYDIWWRYANGSSNRPAAVLVNGNSQASLDMSGTGGWADYAETGLISVYLETGYNEIRLEATASSGLANIDNMVVRNTLQPANCDGSYDASSSSSSEASSSSSSEQSSSASSEPLVLGGNIALDSGADGSSKGGGTSYGSVQDGDSSSYWQPASDSDERISVKGLSGSFNTVIIRELNNAVTSWSLVEHDSGTTLASGSTLGAEAIIGGFTSDADKLNLVIHSASSAPQIAEFEVYNATGSASSSSADSSNSSSTSSSTSSASSSTDTGSSSSAQNSSSSSTSSSNSSSSSSLDYSGPISDDCVDLVNDPYVNWRDTSLQSDQEIVACLSQTLGQPVGYGENARGGYDPAGNSKLTIITKNSSTSVEQQLLDAVTGDDHNWIVFDKFDFANETEISMHRNHCSNPDVLSAIDGSEAQCIDYRQWCADKGISSNSCAVEFYNDRLNDKDLPIRNTKIGSNKTLDGRMSNGYFRFNGFAIGSDSSGQPVQTAESVILTHLDFRGAGHTEDHGLDPDMIRNTGASHDIWIHKNTFDTTGDAAFDVKVGAYDITISFNKLINVKRAALHGSSDSREINSQITTTMHHNAFITTDDQYDNLGNTLRRIPLIRRGTSHMFENFFMNYRKDILSVRVGATVLWEDNMVLMNRIHQEKDDVYRALEERGEELARDVDGGSFRSENTLVWFSDAQCNLDPSLWYEITDASGSVSDLSQNYSQASRDAISENYLGSGQELADYVTATAGKSGKRPFNSPLGYEPYYVLGQGKVPCQ
ncbi:pectate trisaccharide-lyase [Gilvimarinus sp. SDUM040013]|uniref:Pectate trisaccharide-lyase n=1 Tax=Gilvimarinus gilvus TaxID=3058038 RepID=A0ABU4RZN3_9GAMM|nr:pectate trisaccharide-lyase [Gilvimarinus sp. SDUM040013]MDO3386094.1 pectate trisaccharide-lyase [Gilvimarinus sp. SDUM040013]MDX6850365.1 pectate trisaccharide-lyase [Gilvimarinus sp. SDUM040013]